ncbi:hypothetical protein G3R49_00015 [Shewanella sp. WXL01]|uniref:hypothetical protein n=1 Tax=Shewanella sp. WXL01 TaxID=2709721 RepID=UPI0014384109|nr:hypothetical protein [Shewanella sp. WXL01]NKF48958.1 hypothetical protein [Shewanella sp. WXL01]
MKKLTAVALMASALSGCSVYNTIKEVGQLVDYDMVSNETHFITAEGHPFQIAKHRKEEVAKILVCSGASGVFYKEAEPDLRQAANEWLAQKQPGKAAGESNDRSGTWDSKACFEFDVIDPQPIGAYLDEKTGEVVVVGESH